MAFNMKGSPAKLGTIQGTAGHKSALKMAKKSPMEKMPSYIHDIDIDDEGNVKETKRMVSDAAADAVEAHGKKKVSRTGLSDYKHQMKDYDYAKASDEQFIKKDYLEKDKKRTTPKTQTGKRARAIDAMKQSQTNPEVIAEEKKQAKLFPKDVKKAVRMQNIKEQAVQNRYGERTEANKRFKEADAEQTRRKEEKRKKNVASKKKSATPFKAKVDYGKKSDSAWDKVKKIGRGLKNEAKVIAKGVGAGLSRAVKDDHDSSSALPGERSIKAASKAALAERKRQEDTRTKRKANKRSKAVKK
jgi:hypothetical protein